MLYLPNRWRISLFVLQLTNDTIITLSNDGFLSPSLWIGRFKVLVGANDDKEEEEEQVE